MLNLNERRSLSYTRDELILSQLKDIKQDLRELNDRMDNLESKLTERMDRLEGRMDNLENKLTERMDNLENKLGGRMDNLENKLGGRMGKLEDEVRSSSRHSQIMTASVVGIALAVVYFVFTH